MPKLRRPRHHRQPLSAVRAAGLAAAGVLALPLSLVLAAPAHAGLTVSPLVLDLAAGDAPRGDVELRNTGDERLYVRVEPSRIDQPGLPGERRVSDPDPAVLGLIATPGQVILEPGQRKFLRLALLQPAGDAERVFRVTVKPVAGDAAGEKTGLKLMVGYDMLVIQRPAAMKGTVVGRREGGDLVLTNTGNTDVELFRGRRCDAKGSSCTDLPSQRLYAGQSERLAGVGDASVRYVSKIHDVVGEAVF